MSASPSGSSDDRIAILLLGSDQRITPEGAVTLDDLCTDSIIVLSIHPARKTALMLSLPRDTYCRISPRHGWGRINTAYRLGQESGDPDGGGMLAIAAVQNLLEIQIDYYLLINFAAFHTIMDAIGPITVAPRQEIYDDRFPDQNYGYMEVYFPAGPQELDSVKLLQYARVRHTAGYDFGRAGRQQEIIRSVRNRVMSPPVFFHLLREAPALWRGVKPHLATNLPFAKILYVAANFVLIPRENIYSGMPTVQHGQLRNVMTAGQAQVLLPVPGKLRELGQLLIDSSPATVETKTEPDAQPASFVKRIQRLVLVSAIQVVLLLLKSWFALQEMPGRIANFRNGKR